MGPATCLAAAFQSWRGMPASLLKRHIEIFPASHIFGNFKKLMSKHAFSEKTIQVFHPLKKI